MRAAALKIRSFFLLAACLGVSAYFCLEWEQKLAIYPDGRDIVRNQSADEEEDYVSDRSHTESGVAQKISRSGQTLSASYHFINFNKDRLNVSFSMTAGQYKSYLSSYGYSDAEMAALRAWRQQTRTAAWNKAVPSGGKTAGERAIAAVELDYDTRLRGLMRSRGLAVRAGNTVECDMPVIVKRNIQVLQPLALAIQKMSTERTYDSDAMTGAVISLVQTALRYKLPPLLENGVHTGGLLPPARAILSGWGDCDTKTALLASILGSWNTAKMVGIAVPRHYLMAIRRLPGKGDMFVRYDGLEYVLVEPAGPAWLEPGQVGRVTASLLSGAEGYQIEPFF